MDLTFPETLLLSIICCSRTSIAVFLSELFLVTLALGLMAAAAEELPLLVAAALLSQLAALCIESSLNPLVMPPPS